MAGARPDAGDDTRRGALRSAGRVGSCDEVDQNVAGEIRDYAERAPRRTVEAPLISASLSSRAEKIFSRVYQKGYMGENYLKIPLKKNF